MINFPRVLLNKAKDRSLRVFHPWVFSGAIHKVEGNVAEGDMVEVFSHANEYLGTGHYHEGSIKVRIFSFERTDAGPDFWRSKLERALQLRRKLGLLDNPQTNAFRLVHAEGDGLPGLIIDVYDTCAVIQTHTVGMKNAINEIAEVLFDLKGLNLETIYDKSESALQRQNISTDNNRYLKGDSANGIIQENGIKYFVDWTEGQKTGFFLDQRDNRKLLHEYAKDRKVLNTFSYSGGFSMYALHAGAEYVHSVDSSVRAAEWARKNAELNNFTKSHTFFQEDVFDFLKASQQDYDLIILDPPAFAKHLSSVTKATIGYRNLNTEGFKRISPGGFIFTFSCSQVIDKTLFRKIVFQSAAQAGRNVRILHQLTQAPDHPVSIYHPEGEYLKGLVLYVE